MRVKFNEGKQREFFIKVMLIISCPSLNELKNRLVGISYSSLKNYLSGRRLISESFLNDLCNLSGLKKEDFDFELVKDNWGQSKGGKKSKRNGPIKNRT
ncbi:MAG: hypothetical protein KC516_00255 [Nanoarchaeota archaeon]|nr:hypothetical protein [Nanoarchaeota archaeon]